MDFKGIEDNGKDLLTITKDPWASIKRHFIENINFKGLKQT